MALLFAQGTAYAADAASVDTDLDGIADLGDAFPCDWRRTAVTFVPGEQDYATLMFEDNWPARGDLDFNDAVLLHNVALFHDASGRATGLRLTLVPRAIGANIASGVGLRLPIPASSVGSIVRTVGSGSPTALTVLADETDLVVPVVTHLRDLFNGAVGFLNTDRALPVRGDGDVVTIELTFAQPVALSLASDPFDVYFFRSDDPRHQIHRPQFPGTDTMRDELFGTADDGSTGARAFVDTDGMPFVLSIPEQSIWPTERERVERLWPDLTTFAESGGARAQDFYETNVDISKAFPAPASAAVPGLDYAACVAPNCADGARNGVETDVDCGGECGQCGVGGACRVHDDCGTGVCVAAACVQSDERSCVVANGTGTQARAASGWAACVATACDAGSHVEGGACATDVRDCALVGGSGTQSWNGSAYGACTATRCDAGYRQSGGACEATLSIVVPRSVFTDSCTATTVSLDTLPSRSDLAWSLALSTELPAFSGARLDARTGVLTLPPTPRLTSTFTPAWVAVVVESGGESARVEIPIARYGISRWATSQGAAPIFTERTVLPPVSRAAVRSYSVVVAPPASAHACSLAYGPRSEGCSLGHLPLPFRIDENGSVTLDASASEMEPGRYCIAIGASWTVSPDVYLDTVDLIVDLVP